MTTLVDIERAKAALNLVGTEIDPTVEFYIGAASRAVLNYVDGGLDEVLEVDTGGDIPSGVEVPDEVQQATIYMVGHFLRNPDGDPDNAFADGRLPQPARSLLERWRKPRLG